MFASRQDLELLRELRQYLFANQCDHEKPMSGDAIRLALNSMGYKGNMTNQEFRALAMTLKEKLVSNTKR